jgi:hypothetical protein
MGWGFWAILFLIFMLATPALQLGVGAARKWRARRVLERERGARVVPLILDLQTVASYGLPIVRFEQLPLPGELARAIGTTAAGRPIDLVVDLPAGLPLDVFPVAAALAAHPAKTTLIVPRRALVGGLALARAADAVLLGPGAMLCGDLRGDADAPTGGDALPARASRRGDTTCDLADLKDLGLPAGEELPAALPAYLARFREPRRPARRLPFYLSQPRGD